MSHDIIWRLALAFGFWSIATFIGNPFLRNKRLLYISIALGVAATICSILS